MMVALYPHQFPRALLHRLCDGDDDLDDVALLLRGRASKNALHLRIVHNAVIGSPGADAFLAHLEALIRLQRTHPEAVAAVLTGPHFGAWVAHCVRRLSTKDPPDPAMPLAVELGHLGGFVGAAALRARVDVSVSVPLRDSAVVLPGIGRVPLPAQPNAEWAMLRCDADRVVAEAAGATATAWQPLPTVQSLLASGTRWAVTIDAGDPYLRFFEPARDHAIDIARWSRPFQSACAVLDRLYIRKSTAMARAISCLVPLGSESAGFGVSATSAFAAGAVALTEPASALGLAATLVHEHQHHKLNALHDVRPLFTDTSGERHYSPWRNDPRPISGLLHGAYAFLGVGDYWHRVCRSPSTTAQRGPHLELARIARQVDLACAALAGSPELTDIGAELLTHLTRQAHRWRTLDPPSDIARVADDIIVEHQVRWRMRHRDPRADEIRRIADQAGIGSGPQRGAPVTEAAPPPYGTEGGLAAVAKRWAAGEPLTSLVDSLALDGRYAAAQSVLIERVHTGATQQDWITLAVVARHTDLARSCPPLVTHPEVAYALHHELRRRGRSASLAAVARALEGSRYVAGTSISLSVRT